eukprot:1153586-Amphidinium_carterae.1
MFPQAIEPLHQTHDVQQSLNPYRETLLWPGHSLSDPPQPVPPPLDPNQETLLWPGHTLGQTTLLWPGITPQPYPSVPQYPSLPSASNIDNDIGGIQILTDSQMQRQSSASAPPLVDDADMPAPSVIPKKFEEEQGEARGSNDPPRSTPMPPLAESSSRPSSRAASRSGTP